MPFGAELDREGGARFGLWAPAARCVDLALEEGGATRHLSMSAAGDGWFALRVSGTGAGTRYRFVVDGELSVPDPASRFQPEGVNGPSELVDPLAFLWQDADWRGRPWEEAALYELHVGAFSRRGDYAGVAERLEELAALGVTALELMPLAECPGARNWGYDGVLPFAPASRYGRPEDLKRLVEASHRHGLMVFVDVVYNHFGPEGNHLHAYAPDFFTRRHQTPWGDAIDFSGPRSATVRDFFVHNALYWILEYGVDGLRLDAVHAIFDDGKPDFLTELAGRVHAAVGGERRVHLVLENEANEAHRLERASDGRPRAYVAQWNDDLHHAFHVALTGERSGYYVDFAELPVQKLGRCLTRGFAYQGEPSRHRGGRRRGEPSAHLPPTAFVAFLQNHDQIGNRAFGERLIRLAPHEGLRASLAIVLLAPSPPLLFMGEEWGAEQPFPFFCDFEGELAEAVREGRRREFASFPEFRDPAARERIPDPGDPATFESAVLRWEERERPPHRDWLALTRELLWLRRREIAPRLAGTSGSAASFELVCDTGLAAEWRLGDGSRLVLAAQLGADALTGVPELPVREPLFATRPEVPSQAGRGVLPAWSAVWWIEPGR